MSTATAKQLSFIASLGGDPDPTMTMQGASAMIERLLAQRNSQPRASAPELATGVYETADGAIFVVKPNRERSRMYAKQLVEIGGVRATESGERVNIEFEYAPGAIFRLTPDMKMPMNRARELTIRYGRCIVCGRHLKDAESVERGIGPVCAQSFA